jgi:nicotinamidase-related amidase
MNCALVLIDIQNDYFPGGKMELSGSTEAGLRAGEILAFFRENRMPVIHIQHVSARPGATFFLPGTEGAAIHESVRPLAFEEVIEKNYPNSFRNTPLRESLERGKINQLVIAGMMTHMCVDATVRSAFDFGFTCTLIHDACATKDLSFEDQTVPAKQVHAAFLSALNGLYAKVVSTSEFIASFK